MKLNGNWTTGFLLRSRIPEYRRRLACDSVRVSSAPVWSAVIRTDLLQAISTWREKYLPNTSEMGCQDVWAVGAGSRWAGQMHLYMK